MLSLNFWTLSSTAYFFCETRQAPKVSSLCNCGYKAFFISSLFSNLLKLKCHFSVKPIGQIICKHSRKYCKRQQWILNFWCKWSHLWAVPSMIENRRVFMVTSCSSRSNNDAKAGTMIFYWPNCLRRLVPYLSCPVALVSFPARGHCGWWRRQSSQSSSSYVSSWTFCHQNCIWKTQRKETSLYTS